MFRVRSLVFSLVAVWTSANPQMMANIIANGDFTANASSFTTWPGYLGSGDNPQIQSWSYSVLSGGTASAGINGPNTGVGAPFAPTSAVGVDNFAFIQNGAAVLTQGLPTLLPNQEYCISVAAANRSGQPDASGRIQIGDATTVFYTSGDQSFSTEAFQTITATFTTPATFNGTPSIQLYGFSGGGDSVAYTNVRLGKPIFRADGADLTALDLMLQRFYAACNMDIVGTFPLAWLPPAMLWVGDSPQVSTSPMRARIANRIGNMRISDEGYVSCHQHEGLAHSEGWPFPLPTQGGGIGYYFTVAGLPYGPELGIHPTTQVDDWQLSGASGTTLDPAKGWQLQLTAPNATITSPAFDLNAFVSPFIRVKWDATGLPEGSLPYLEWTTATEPQFSAARRIAFPQPSSSSHPPVLDFDIPVHEITGAKGRITQLRIGFGNPVPGQVTIQRLFSAVDSRHTVNNSNYLIAAADFFEWTGDKAWLSSNLVKMRRAADYMISEFKVREAHLLRTPWVGHDGRSGLEIMPDGRKVIRHGVGVGGNYWDLIPFGGDDVLGTIYLYSALRRTARIEQFVAADAAVQAPAAGLDSASLNALADAVRAKFQQTFWNPETKRFAPKDDQGRFRDYGFTFLNNEAIYYGLASDTQAREILAWTEGDRVVAGDTSQGDDIYHWRFAPRATTKRNIEYYAYVWSSPESIQFGDQVQDGGAVLGFTYHDLMARIRHLGPDNAWQRLGEILAWYDEVEEAGGPRAYYSVPGRGNLQGGGTAGGLGIDREFYESVLAPAIVLDGFIGFGVRPDGFDLAPRLPTAVKSLGLSNVAYRDLCWDIDISPDSIAFAVKSGKVDAPLRIRLPKGAWTGTIRTAADAEPQTVEIASGPQGFELPAGPLHELLLKSVTATATSGIWDIDANGYWDTAINWLDSTLASGADSTAFFTNELTGDRTVTLATARTIGHLTFTDGAASSNNLTINGENILTLDVTTGSPIIDVTQADRTLNISNQIAGTDGLSKSGAGTLNLMGANIYTGATTINAGKLRIGAETIIPINPVIIPNAGFEEPATTHWTGTPADGSWTFSAAGVARNTWFVTAPPRGLQAGFLQGGTASISQSIDVGMEGLYQITFEALGRDGAFGPQGIIVQVDEVTVGSWTAEEVSQSAWLSYSAMVNLTAGSHTLTFLGNNTLGGDKSVSIDNVQMAQLAFGLLPTATDVNLTTSGATLDLNFTTQTISSLAGVVGSSVANGNLTTGGSGTSTTFAGVFSGRSHLTKEGAGTLTLTGMNTYTGLTRIEEGKLSLSQAYLHDAASVAISTNGILDLNHSLTDTVGTLVLAGVQARVGLWGRIGSKAALGAQFESALITGDGLLMVTTSPDPIAAWLREKITDIDPLADATATGDADGDGINNASEFAFDGNPLSGSNDGKIVGQLVTLGGESVLTLTVPVRAGAIFTSPGSPTNLELVSVAIDGVIYRIQGSDSNLADWTLGINEITGTVVDLLQQALPALNSGWEYRTFRTRGSTTTDPTKFIRAAVSLA